MARLKTGVLISGKGTNLQALLDAAADQSYPAEIVSVIANKAGAPGLERARKVGVKARFIDHTLYDEREDFERELDGKLREDGVEFVALAGFMRILSPWFVDKWRDRLINIHPSLLPAFKGVHTHERALESGVRIHGATVHYVRPEMDEGPIIGQAAVPVMPGDSKATLADRVLEAEHKLYPACLRLVAENRARVTAGLVRMDKDSAPNDGHILLNPSA
jgi:phosphoribosylglycinamide formyltransferase-1